MHQKNVELVWEQSNHTHYNQIKPRMLCYGNGALPHFQMAVAVKGFVEDFHYGLHNS